MKRMNDFQVVLCYGVPAASAARGMVSYLPSSPHLDDTQCARRHAGTHTCTYVSSRHDLNLITLLLPIMDPFQSIILQSRKSLVTSTSSAIGYHELQSPSAIFPSCSKTISSLHRAPSHEDVPEATASSLDVIHAWGDFTRISTTPVT